MSWRDATVADLLGWAPTATRRHPVRRRTRTATLVDWLGRPARVAAVTGLILLGSLAVITWPVAMAAAIASLRASDRPVWTWYWSHYRCVLRDGLLASVVLTPVVVVIIANLGFLAGTPGPYAAAFWLVNLTLLGLWWCLAAGTAESLAQGGSVPPRARLRLIMVQLFRRPGRSLLIVLCGWAVAGLMVLVPLAGFVFGPGLIALVWSRLGGDLDARP